MINPEANKTLPWGTELAPSNEAVANNIFEPGVRFIFLKFMKDGRVVILQKGGVTPLRLDGKFVDFDANPQ